MIAVQPFGRLVACLAALAVTPWAADADIAPEDLPADTRWYLHVDFERMRTSNGVGRNLFDWFSGEVFAELDDKIGIDLTESLDGVTAFGGDDDSDNAAVVLHGRFEGRVKNRLIEFIEQAGEYEKEDRKGHEVYSFTDLDVDVHGGIDVDIAGDDEPSYVVFGSSGQILITESPNVVENFVESGGRITRSRSDRPDVMLVLHAERSLVKGGFNTKTVKLRTNWNSSVLNNVEQLAVVIADEGWAASVSAKLITSSTAMAGSLTSIIQGLISLKSLDDGNDERVKSLLANTKVDHDDKSVSISTHLETGLLLDLLDN